jgi:ubiquitin-conjugating enzyme E2 C
MSGSKEVSAFPVGDNLFEWVATLHGSKGTAYDGLVYKLAVKFPADYPFTAPTVTFTTPCWHPNVDGAGNICVDFLKERWSAAYSISSLLLSLQSLLSDPNPASPLNPQAAALWADPVEYRKVRRQRVMQ